MKVITISSPEVIRPALVLFKEDFHYNKDSLDCSFTLLFLKMHKILLQKVYHLYVVCFMYFGVLSHRGHWIGLNWMINTYLQHRTCLSL